MKETVILNKPVKEDGKDIREVVLDLDALTGQDMVDSEREYLTSGGIPTNLSSSVGYLQYVAACACGLDVTVIRRMSAKDSTYLTTRTQVFLLDMEIPSLSGSSEKSV